MLLAIDAGNTNTVIALFESVMKNASPDNNTLIAKWRLQTETKRTADEYGSAISAFLALKNFTMAQITDVIISCVVPQNMFALKTFSRDYCGTEALVVGEVSLDLGIKLHLDNPAEVGADRLVNALAAFALYKKPSIVIDFGTATTFDVIAENGDYLGGVIAPGLHLSLEALQKAAAKLPEVELKRPDAAIGRNTISAMQSGIYFGYIGLIEGIVRRIRAEMNLAKPLITIATGGLAPLFAKATPAIEHLETDLTLYGLRLIFERTRK